MNNPSFWTITKERINQEKKINKCSNIREQDWETDSKQYS